MDRRLQLWLGVSACALLGATVLPMPVFAQMGGGGSQGNSRDHDIDPDGGMLHECGEPGGCAEAGESFESRSADEFGDDADDDQPALVTPTEPLSGDGGLSEGDSIKGGVNDGGLGN